MVEKRGQARMGDTRWDVEGVSPGTGVSSCSSKDPRGFLSSGMTQRIQ